MNCDDYGLEHESTQSTLICIVELKVKLAEAESRASCKCCPCEFLTVEPCDPDCSCAKPYMSRGCQRCVLYGSSEQQAAAAQNIAAREKRCKGLEAKLAQSEAQVAAASKWIKEEFGANCKPADYDKDCIECTAGKLISENTAGRALLERMEKLEAVATAARKNVVNGCQRTPIPVCICGLCEELAALDKKEENHE